MEAAIVKKPVVGKSGKSVQSVWFREEERLPCWAEGLGGRDGVGMYWGHMPMQVPVI